LRLRPVQHSDGLIIALDLPFHHTGKNRSLGTENRVDRINRHLPTPEEFGRWPAAAPKYGLELLWPPFPE
jgi:hypothetical protein